MAKQLMGKEVLKKSFYCFFLMVWSDSPPSPQDTLHWLEKNKIVLLIIQLCNEYDLGTALLV